MHAIGVLLAAANVAIIPIAANNVILALSSRPVCAPASAPMIKSGTISPPINPQLNFSTTTGEISGTANSTQSNTTYTITASDLTPTSINKTFYLTVNAPTPLVATTVIPSQTILSGDAVIGLAPVTATGGYGLLTWSVSPALPTGLAINPSTGAITGTTTSFSAATTYTITVSDEAQQSTSGTFSLEVDSPTLVVTQVIPSKTIIKDVATQEFAPVTATGGTTVYTFTISRALPTGLSFSSTTGKISGTPTVVDGPTSYTITVRDTSNKTAFKTLSYIDALRFCSIYEKCKITENGKNKIATIIFNIFSIIFLIIYKKPFEIILLTVNLMYK
jgi:hypothetical protein